MIDPSGDFRVGPPSDPDRYSIGPATGGGAEGVLYPGTLTTTGGLRLDVAVKMLHPRFLARIHQWQRIWSEQLELLRSLQVPGVVRVRDGFVGPLPHPPKAARPEPRTLYLVMNWIDGIPLDEWVRQRTGTRDPVEDLKVLLPVAAALDLMHSGAATGGVPIVHRDIKPSNILVTGDGTVLVDFGLVRGLPGGQRTSGVTGTPGYIAPETHERGEYTPASDRYALGGVAFFVLTGVEPPVLRGLDVIADQLGRASTLTDHPETIDHVLAMLSDDPNERPVHLANWIAQARRSSLDAQPSVLRPMAPTIQAVTAERGQRLAAMGRSSPVSVTRVTRSRFRPRSKLFAVATLAVVAVVGVLAARSLTTNPRASRRSAHVGTTSPMPSSGDASVPTGSEPDVPGFSNASNSEDAGTAPAATTTTLAERRPASTSTTTTTEPSRLAASNEPAADLRIDATGASSMTCSNRTGCEMRWPYEIANLGPSNAANVSVLQTLRCDGQVCSESAGPWRVGPLDANGTKSNFGFYRVRPGRCQPGAVSQVSVLIVVSADTPDPNPDNNRVSRATTRTCVE